MSASGIITCPCGSIAFTNKNGQPFCVRCGEPMTKATIKKIPAHLTNARKVAKK